MAIKQTPALERQQNYLMTLPPNFKFGLTVGAAFVRGIRESGYKHTGTALDDLIDNSFEAGASNVHVVLQPYEGGSDGRKNNVSKIAVIDDGSGMLPDMIRVAVMWGGTDRENSRRGIGRFGFGLPSACVSQGRRFEVYSAPEGGKVHMCEVDLDEIEAGKYTDETGEIIVPQPKQASLPQFVQDYVKASFPGGNWKKGTVVVIDKIDKPSWKALSAFQNNLLEHFGVVYHKLRGQFDIVVNGRTVEPIDPLFLTPGFRWFDLDADRATALDPRTIEVKNKDTRETIGHIKVRYSYMPPTFASIDKKKAAAGKNANERFKILKQYNGFIIARNGRLIHTVASSPLTTFLHNDRYIKIEIDFDAALDEEFNVPTTKQRVDLSDRVWDILADAGVEKALEQLRRKFKEEKARIKSEFANSTTGKRASEAAMEESQKFRKVVPLPVKERRDAEGQKRLQQEAEKRALASGKSETEALREIEAELGGKPYKVAMRSIPGGVFFEVEQLGGTKVLWLNTASKFFQAVHSAPNSTPEVRAALEILLFAIGDSALDGSDEVRRFYNHEVPTWSQKLELALSYLSQHLGEEDDEDDEGLAANG